LTFEAVCDIFHNIVKNFTNTPGPTKPHVVIIGAGFGGLRAAQALAKAPVDVTVIDAHNRFTFQPLLYQVATATLDPDEIAYPVRGILQRQRNARFRMARVRGVDWNAKHVLLTDQDALPFDYLIVAAGAVTNDFGLPGAAAHAFGLKSLEDAMALRNHIVRTFERVDANPALAADGALSFVVVGGGPIGVEVAGALSELIHDALRRDFPHLDASSMRVTLLDAQERLLTAFDPQLSASAYETLRARGIDVLLNRNVASVSPAGITLTDGTRIAAHTVVWGAGVRAHPLAQALGVELTRAGRVVVAPDLSIPAHPFAFVIGDMAAALDASGQPLPQMAQPAMQGGAHAAAQIVRRLSQMPGAPFVYRNLGSMATIGRNAAVAQFPNGWRFSGFFAWLMWVVLHLLRLVGVRNQLNVLVNWIVAYITRQQGGRMVVGEVAASPSVGHAHANA
jgi:NADH:ubiquinone reductase (H+-translocating)